MRKIQYSILLFVSLVIFSAINSNAQTQRRIVFKRDASLATVSGALTVGETREYVVAARRGQTITVVVKSRRNLIHFTNEVADVVETKRTYRAQAGDNYISIQNDSSKTENYTLIVTIR